MEINNLNWNRDSESDDSMEESKIPYSYVSIYCEYLNKNENFIYL